MPTLFISGAGLCSANLVVLSLSNCRREAVNLRHGRTCHIPTFVRSAALLPSALDFSSTRVLARPRISGGVFLHPHIALQLVVRINSQPYVEFRRGSSIHQFLRSRYSRIGRPSSPLWPIADLMAAVCQIRPRALWRTCPNRCIRIRVNDEL
jgi:hypothetical protein